MAFRTNTKKQSIVDSEEEEEEAGIVDLEEELISALDELKKARKKNKQLKEELQRAEEGMYNSNNEEFSYEKEKLEEAIKRKYSLILLLEEK